MALSISRCLLLSSNIVNHCKTKTKSRGYFEQVYLNVLRCASFQKSTGSARYLTCMLYSQQNINNKTATPAPLKPGLIKRALVKSDEAFCAVLRRTSPWMLQEYENFKIGFMAFTADVKAVFGLRKRIRQEKLSLPDLHWKDLYLIKQISNDMAKMGPTVLLLCLPIIYYFVLPLAFLYPTVFLSNQFLSRDKLLRYYLKSYRQRAALYPTLLTLLSQQAERLRSDDIEGCPLAPVIAKLRSDEQITAQQLLQTKEVFQGIPLKDLTRSHLACLCRLCSLRTMFMPGLLLRRKLNKNVLLMQAMDHSIRKEGGASRLEHLELEKLCYERGLNVLHLDKTDLEAWLEKWLRLTEGISFNDVDRSLAAHAVAMLVIGHPSCHQLNDVSKITEHIAKNG